MCKNYDWSTDSFRLINKKLQLLQFKRISTSNNACAANVVPVFATAALVVVSLAYLSFISLLNW